MYPTNHHLNLKKILVFFRRKVLNIQSKKDDASMLKDTYGILNIVGAKKIKPSKVFGEGLQKHIYALFWYIKKEVTDNDYLVYAWLQDPLDYIYEDTWNNIINNLGR